MTPRTIALVQWLVAISVCITVYLLVRRIRLFMVLLMLEATLFIVISVNGFRDNLVALCFIGGGMFPLLTRSYHRSMFTKLNRVWASNRRMVASSLLVCCVLALIAGLLIPSDTSAWKNQRLSDLYKKFSPFQSSSQTELFSLHSSGLQPNPDRLGGNIKLDHTPVLKVTTENPTLLKGKVYTNYTGKGWNAEDERSLDVQDKDNLPAYSQAFDLGRPQLQNGTNPLSNAIPDISDTVTLLDGGYSLFTAGRVFSLSIVNTGTNTSILFNARSELFSARAFPENYKYQFSSHVLNRDADRLESRIQAIEKGSASSSSEYAHDSHYDAIYHVYTQLPASLPGDVKTLAKIIASGKASTYAKMEALESYLKSNYAYTLTPGDVPPNEDFVNYFLKSKNGYCVYFASAMTVMARTLGVPARFVIGYGLKGSGTSWTAYGDTAHAWVECYIRGVGWTTFDPTASSNYSNPAAAAPSPTDLPATTTTKTAATTTAPSSKPSAAVTTTRSETSSPVSTASLFRLAAILLGAALLILLAYFLLRAQRQRTAYTLDNVRGRCRTNAACADCYYTDILRQLELLGYSPHPGETIYQHGRRVGPLIGQETQDAETKDTLLEEAFDTVMNWRYGEITPTDEELKKLSDLHNGLEEKVRTKLGTFRHALVRYLFAK